MTHHEKTHSLLDSLYCQGLFTYLLFFIPLLPGFTEIHAKLCLATLKVMNCNIKSAEEGIALVFGKKGLKVYTRYILDYQAVIFPRQIFSALYEEDNHSKALKLISRVFFDRYQRSFAHSDVIRAVILKEIPHMIEAFSEPCYRHFRTRLIQIMGSEVHIEQSTTAKVVAIETMFELLILTAAIATRRREIKINAEFDMLAARIQAELAGSSSVYSAFSLSPAVLNKLPEHLLTDEDLYSLKKILHLQVQGTAPVVKQKALEILAKVHDLDIYNLYDIPIFYPSRKTSKHSLLGTIIT